MLGPLPRLYQVLVVVTALTVCMVGGAWAAFVLPYPILVVAGASVGLAVGATCAFLLLHEFRREPAPHRWEHPRRR